MAIYSRVLAWKIPWTEEPGRLQFLGLPRVRQDLETEHACLIRYTKISSKWIEYWKVRPETVKLLSDKLRENGVGNDILGPDSEGKVNKTKKETHQMGALDISLLHFKGIWVFTNLLN